MAIPPQLTYQTSVSEASNRRAYATAGANPNALAYGLGTDLFASILEFIITQVNSTATLHVFMGQTVEAYHPLKKSGVLFQLSGVLTPTLLQSICRLFQGNFGDCFEVLNQGVKESLVAAVLTPRLNFI